MGALVLRYLAAGLSAAGLEDGDGGPVGVVERVLNLAPGFLLIDDPAPVLASAQGPVLAGRIGRTSRDGWLAPVWMRCGPTLTVSSCRA